MSNDNIPALKVGIGWIDLEVISDPDVVLTFKGYAPILRVRQLNNDLEYILYISAKSLGESLEKLRENNCGVFRGIQFSVRKKDTTPMAPYEIKGKE
jgi:hypothetical protein